MVTTKTRPKTSSSGRSFTGSGTYRNNEVTGTISYQYSVTGIEELFADMYDWLHYTYVETSRRSIEQYLGDDPDSYTLVVDGRKDVPLEVASLTGSGIIAGRQGNTDNLKKAFEAAMNYLRSVVPGIFKRSTGTYASSGHTAGFFTVLVNGIEQAPDWDKITSASNIQIYSKARHASPVESMHHGKILLQARNVAAKIEGINASFTYRNPQKKGQVAVVSRSGRGETPKGQPFRPLAVPVLEIGTVLSNVTNYVGNISFNLEKNRKRKQKNLVDRGILPEKRRIDRRVRNVPPRKRR